MKLKPNFGPVEPGLGLNEYCRFVEELADQFPAAEARSEFTKYFESGEAQRWSGLGETFDALESQPATTEGHAAAAAILGRCRQLWEAGHFRTDGYEVGDRSLGLGGAGPLAAIAAERLQARLAAGCAPAGALQELLAALLALHHAVGDNGEEAEESGSEGTGDDDVDEELPDLCLSAVVVAAYVGVAWAKHHTQQLPVPPPLLWKEGGVLHCLSLALDKCVEYEYCAEFNTQMLSDCFRAASAMLPSLISCSHREMREACWRWVLPAMMAACCWIDKCGVRELPDDESCVLCAGLVEGLEPLLFLLVREDDQRSRQEQAQLAEQLPCLDRFSAIHGLTRAFATLVDATCTSPQEGLTPSQVLDGLEGDAGWWIKLNRSLTSLLRLLHWLVCKHNIQPAVFLEQGGMQALLTFLQVCAPRPHDESQLPTHVLSYHWLGVKLLHLAATLMAHPQGAAAQAAFGAKGVKLCLDSLRTLPPVAVLVTDKDPERWTTCKYFLCTLEAACCSTSSANEANCRAFVESGGVGVVLRIATPEAGPPPEATLRGSSGSSFHTRTAALAQNGFSLLSSVMQAHTIGGAAFLSGGLDADFEWTMAHLMLVVMPISVLMRVVQWGGVVKPAALLARHSLFATAPSNQTFLSSALSLVRAAVDNRSSHSAALASSALAGSAAHLGLLHRAGLQSLDEARAIRHSTSLLNWLQAVRALAEHEPHCHHLLLDNSICKLAGACALDAYQAFSTAQAVQSSEGADAGSQAQPTVVMEPGPVLLAVGSLVCVLLGQRTASRVLCMEAILAGAGSLADGAPDGKQQPSRQQQKHEQQLPAELEQLRVQLQAAQSAVDGQRLHELAVLEDKQRAADAAADALLAMEQEEQAQQAEQQAAQQAKKAAKKQKQQQKKKEQEEAAAAERRAAEAERQAAEAQRQRQREEQQRRQQQQRQQQQEEQAAAASKSKKKKQKKQPLSAGRVAESATPVAAAAAPPNGMHAEGLASEVWEGAAAAGWAADEAVVSHAAGPGPADAAAASSEQDQLDEVQSLLAQLMPGLFTGGRPSAAPGAGAAGAAGDASCNAVVEQHQAQEQLQQQQQQQQQQQLVQQPGDEQDWREPARSSRLPAPLRAVLQCPLTGCLMSDPVVLADGHSYERGAAEAWLAQSGCSPLTGEPLAFTAWRPNHALRQLMEEGV